MNSDEISFSSAEDEPLEKVSPESAPESAIKDVGESEKRWVMFSKGFVVAVLLASAGGFAYLTHFFMSSEEKESFVAKFRFDAKNVLDRCRAKGASLRSNILTSSLTFTSYANYQKATFPNFSLPVSTDVGIDISSHISMELVWSKSERSQLDFFLTCVGGRTLRHLQAWHVTSLEPWLSNFLQSFRMMPERDSKHMQWKMRIGYLSPSCI